MSDPTNQPAIDYPEDFSWPHVVWFCPGHSIRDAEGTLLRVCVTVDVTMGGV